MRGPDPQPPPSPASLCVGTLPIAGASVPTRHRKGVALENGPLHGYAVIERLKLGSAGYLDLPTGTVYPTLHRLERAGLLRSRWSTTASRRRRRTYELTEAGAAALHTSRSAWQQFSTAVSALLGKQSWPATS